MKPCVPIVSTQVKKGAHKAFEAILPLRFHNQSRPSYHSVHVSWQQNSYIPALTGLGNTECRDIATSFNMRQNKLVLMVAFCPLRKLCRYARKASLASTWFYEEWAIGMEELFQWDLYYLFSGLFIHHLWQDWIEQMKYYIWDRLCAKSQIIFN